eukprot:gnl/Chilomastix_caulleri/2626.p2 GENE.gnl/Chilomastix_caulleri/2626~~gnl/Chilomastix_caulleri/2626.p2  ORF type:complete len:78 (+),score=1.00 gnl/Chilomastix_caulleri/2626:57-290(+)
MSLHFQRHLSIPKEVKVTVSKRKVTVSGPRGILSRDFDDSSVEMSVTRSGRKLFVGTWLARRKHPHQSNPLLHTSKI